MSGDKILIRRLHTHHHLCRCAVPVNTPPMRAAVCTAKASYKKVSGQLELTDTHLQWTQDGKKTPSVRVPHAEAACQSIYPSLSDVFSPAGPALFCSKEGAAQVRLKLGLMGDDAGHNFTFTSPQPVAYTEREKFKKELTNIISRNRSGIDHLLKPPVTALSSTPSNAPTPRPLLAASRPSTSRAASVSSDGRSPVILGDDPAREFRLRKKILISNPDLGALHRELVMNGPITEAEFWDGREVSP
jgi:transcription initiation factor TFIIH subunit 1